MEREIKFRAWNTVLKEMLPVVGNISFSKDRVSGLNAGKTNNWLKDGWTKVEKEDIEKVILMQYTGLKDNSPVPNEVYEGDIIDYNGVVVSNIYESSQIQQDGTNHVIANMGTEAWRESESVAMGRGCKYA